jgi:hypothetical protein
MAWSMSLKSSGVKMFAPLSGMSSVINSTPGSISATLKLSVEKMGPFEADSFEEDSIVMGRKKPA